MGGVLSAKELEEAGWGGGGGEASSKTVGPEDIALKQWGGKAFQVEESGHAKAWEHKGVSPGAGTWKGRRGWKS